MTKDHDSSHGGSGARNKAGRRRSRSDKTGNVPEELICQAVHWIERFDSTEAQDLSNPAPILGDNDLAACSRPGEGISATLARQERERRLVARAMVSVLLATPQQVVGGRGALKAGPERRPSAPDSSATPPPPTLSYEQVNERFIFNGPLAVSSLCEAPRSELLPGGAFEQRMREINKLRKRNTSNAREDDDTLKTMSESIPKPAQRRRPGRGGRGRRTGVFTESTATAELRNEIGEPQRSERIHGVQYMEWILPGHGDGALVARLSGQEMNGGETVMGQIHGLRRLQSQLERQAKYIIVTTDNSGAQLPEARPDLVRLRDLITQGMISWVGFRDTSRIARAEYPRAVTYHLLQTAGTDLCLSELGRTVNWDKDDIYLSAAGMMDQQERKRIIERTQAPIITRRLAEGHGRPGTLPFGFYWDRELQRPFVDPEQWPFVKQVHLTYNQEAKERHRGSMSRVEQALRNAGCPMSKGMIRHILQRAIYVTGEYTATWQAERVSCIPIPLDDPIPMPVFEENQELLALSRGPNSRVPVGYFALNGVEFCHETCINELVPNPNTRKASETQPRLRGRIYGKRVARPMYIHEPAAPECCKRWTLAPAVIEPIVMGALRDLARSEVLREEWLACERSAGRPGTSLLAADQRGSLIKELRRLDDLVEGIEARRIDPKAPESKLESLDYLELVLPPKRRTEQIRRQLHADEVLAPAPVAPPIAGKMRPLAEAADLGDDAIYAELVAALEEILTDEVPADPEMVRRRAAIVKASISRVTIADDYAAGTFTVKLEGPLVPPNFHADGPIGPVASAREILRAHCTDKARQSDGARSVTASATPSGLEPGGASDSTPSSTIHTPVSKKSLAERRVKPSTLPLETGREVTLQHGDVLDRYYKHGLAGSKVREARRTRSHQVDARISGVSLVPVWVSPSIEARGRFRPLPQGLVRAIESIRLVHRSERRLINSHQYQQLDKSGGLASGASVYATLSAAGLRRAYAPFRDWILGMNDGSEFGLTPGHVFQSVLRETTWPEDAWRPGDADAKEPDARSESP